MDNQKAAAAIDKYLINIQPSLKQAEREIRAWFRDCQLNRRVHSFLVMGFTGVLSIDVVYEPGGPTHLIRRYHSAWMKQPSLTSMGQSTSAPELDVEEVDNVDDAYDRAMRGI